MRAIRPADGSTADESTADESTADESPADQSAVRATRPVDQGSIRLATILGVLSTAALLGVVSVAAGLGVAAWIAGLAAGWAATMFTARMRSDQPNKRPGWVTLTRAVLCAGVAGLVAASLSFGLRCRSQCSATLSAIALALDAVDGQVVARRTGTVSLAGRPKSMARSTPSSILLLSIFVSQAYGSWVLMIVAPLATRCCWRAG